MLDFEVILIKDFIEELEFVNFMEVLYYCNWEFVNRVIELEIVLEEC